MSAHCSLRAHAETDHTLNLSELKALHTLEILTARDSGKALAQTLHRITQIIDTSTPRPLRHLMIASTCSFQYMTYFSQAWDHDAVRKQCHLLDEAMTLNQGEPSLSVTIQEAKENRQGFWSKILHNRFSRLDEVQCSSGARSMFTLQYTSDLFSIGPGNEKRLGHDARVTAIAASPNGQIIATGANDGTVLIWIGTIFTESSPSEIQGPKPDDPVTLLSLLSKPNVDGMDVTYLIVAQAFEFHVWCICVDKYMITTLNEVSSSGFSSQIGNPFLARQKGLQEITDNSRILFCVPWLQPDGSSTNTIASLLKVSNNGALDTCIVSLRENSRDYHVSTLNLGFVDGQYKRSYVLAQSSSGRSIAVEDLGEVGVFRLHFGCQLYPDQAFGFDKVKCTYGQSTIPLIKPFCATFADDDWFVVGFSDGAIRWWNVPPYRLEDVWDHTLSPPQPVTFCNIHNLYPGDVAVTSLSVSPQSRFLLACPQDDKNPAVAVLRLKDPTGIYLLATPFIIEDQIPTLFYLRGHTEQVLATCACHRASVTLQPPPRTRPFACGVP